MASAEEWWAEMTDDGQPGNSSFACSHPDFWFRDFRVIMKQIAGQQVAYGHS